MSKMEVLTGTQNEFEKNLAMAQLKSAVDSIKRSLGRGIEPRDTYMYLRALCSDVEGYIKAIEKIEQ